MRELTKTEFAASKDKPADIHLSKLLQTIKIKEPLGEWWLTSASLINYNN